MQFFLVELSSKAANGPGGSGPGSSIMLAEAKMKCICGKASSGDVALLMRQQTNRVDLHFFFVSSKKCCKEIWGPPSGINNAA